MFFGWFDPNKIFIYFFLEYYFSVFYIYVSYPFLTLFNNFFFKKKLNKYSNYTKYNLSIYSLDYCRDLIKIRQHNECIEKYEYFLFNIVKFMETNSTVEFIQHRLIKNLIKFFFFEEKGIFIITPDDNFFLDNLSIKYLSTGKNKLKPNIIYEDNLNDFWFLFNILLVDFMSKGALDYYNNFFFFEEIVIDIFKLFKKNLKKSKIIFWPFWPFDQFLKTKNFSFFLKTWIFNKNSFFLINCAKIFTLKNYSKYSKFINFFFLSSNNLSLFYDNNINDDAYFLPFKILFKDFKKWWTIYGNSGLNFEEFEFFLSDDFHKYSISSCLATEFSDSYLLKTNSNILGLHTLVLLINDNDYLINFWLNSCNFDYTSLLWNYIGLHFLSPQTVIKNFYKLYKLYSISFNILDKIFRFWKSIYFVLKKYFIPAVDLPISDKFLLIWSDDNKLLDLSSLIWRFSFYPYIYSHLFFHKPYWLLFFVYLNNIFFFHYYWIFFLKKKNFYYYIFGWNFFFGPTWQLDILSKYNLKYKSNTDLYLKYFENKFNIYYYLTNSFLFYQANANILFYNQSEKLNLILLNSTFEYFTLSQFFNVKGFFLYTFNFTYYIRENFFFFPIFFDLNSDFSFNSDLSILDEEDYLEADNYESDYDYFFDLNINLDICLKIISVFWFIKYTDIKFFTFFKNEIYSKFINNNFFYFEQIQLELKVKDNFNFFFIYLFTKYWFETFYESDNYLYYKDNCLNFLNEFKFSNSFSNLILIKNFIFLYLNFFFFKFTNFLVTNYLNVDFYTNYDLSTEFVSDLFNFLKINYIFFLIFDILVQEDWKLFFYSRNIIFSLSDLVTNRSIFLRNYKFLFSSLKLANCNKFNYLIKFVTSFYLVKTFFLKNYVWWFIKNFYLFLFIDKFFFFWMILENEESLLSQFFQIYKIFFSSFFEKRSFIYSEVFIEENDSLFWIDFFLDVGILELDYDLENWEVEIFENIFSSNYFFDYFLIYNNHSYVYTFNVVSIYEYLFNNDSFLFSWFAIDFTDFEFTNFFLNLDDEASLDLLMFEDELLLYNDYRKRLFFFDLDIFIYDRIFLILLKKYSLKLFFFKLFFFWIFLYVKKN